MTRLPWKASTFQMLAPPSAACHFALRYPLSSLVRHPPSAPSIVARLVLSPVPRTSFSSRASSVPFFDTVCLALLIKRNEARLRFFSTKPKKRRPELASCQGNASDVDQNQDALFKKSPVHALSSVSANPHPSASLEGDVQKGSVIKPKESVLQSSASAEELERARQLVLSPPALVVTREYEWGNILLGFEQANRYTIRAAPSVEVVGYIAERDNIAKSIGRNILRTHRGFEATVLSKEGVPVFRIKRPMYLISTSLFVETPEGELLGEVHMRWHLYRRRYELVVDGKQFANVDSGFLSFDFTMKDETDRTIASVNRDFTGFARELFTDTGQYVLRLDPTTGLGDAKSLVSDPSAVAPRREGGQHLGPRERAVILGCAISIDFDYFSRHSRGGGTGFLPFLWGGGGGSAADASENSNNDTSEGTGSSVAADERYGIEENERDEPGAPSFTQADSEPSADIFGDSPQGKNELSDDGVYKSWERQDEDFGRAGNLDTKGEAADADSGWGMKDGEWNDPWTGDGDGGGEDADTDEGEGGIGGLVRSIFETFRDSNE